MVDHMLSIDRVRTRPAHEKGTEPTKNFGYAGLVYFFGGGLRLRSTCHG